jgi:hypothetical protein
MLPAHTIRLQGDRGDWTFGFFSGIHRPLREIAKPRSPGPPLSRAWQRIWISSSRPSTTGVSGPPRRSDSSAPGWPFRAERLADYLLEIIDGKGFREDGHARYAEETGVVE